MEYTFRCEECGGFSIVEANSDEEHERTLDFLRRNNPDGKVKCDECCGGNDDLVS